MPENQEALRVYAYLSHPLAQDFPLARDLAAAVLDLRLTRGRAERLWRRLGVIDDFVRGERGEGKGQAD